jgi:hypothetical protein
MMNGLSRLMNALSPSNENEIACFASNGENFSADTSVGQIQVAEWEANASTNS